jgi:hypothetical protein
LPLCSCAIFYGRDVTRGQIVVESVVPREIFLIAERDLKTIEPNLRTATREKLDSIAAPVWSTGHISYAPGTYTMIYMCGQQWRQYPVQVILPAEGPPNQYKAECS